MRKTKKLTLSALFLALGLVMPFLTMQIPEIGSMLLPMHIPVLLCGFVCGWKYGFVVGFIVPILRSFIWGMPVMVPAAITMAFELAAYGIMTGILYKWIRGKQFAAYITLILSMMVGRVVWGLISFIVFSMLRNPFTWELFAAGAFVQAIPGIMLQLVIIPPIIGILHKSGFMDR